MNMDPIHRRVTYKLYPTAPQRRGLERLFDLHRQLYNAALEERIDAWRKAGLSISFQDQCKSLTVLRRQDPDYLSVNAQSAQVTLKRLDRAFKSFFRRVAAGQTPGFPRFKGRDRFPGWGYKRHGDGFKFTPGGGWKHGRLRLSGIGDVKARGQARTPGRIVCCDIQRRAGLDGEWYASIVVACEPHRERLSAAEGGGRMAGLDWGVESFATLAYGPGDYETVENDRLLLQETEALKQEQRALSYALRGRRSNRARRMRLKLVKRHLQVANRRKDRMHKLTARLVRSHDLIAGEKMTISTMTRSAKGTVEDPGRQVRQKAGLNRAILDTAPGGFHSMLRTKAEEAGCELVLLDVRRHRPSQTCPCCGSIRRKELSERRHRCGGCGFEAGRDEAAALALLTIALRKKGREPTWAVRLETQPRAA